MGRVWLGRTALVLVASCSNNLTLQIELISRMNTSLGDKRCFSQISDEEGLLHWTLGHAELLWWALGPLVCASQTAQVIVFLEGMQRVGRSRRLCHLCSICQNGKHWDAVLPLWRGWADNDTAWGWIRPVKIFPKIKPQIENDANEV